jgi:hypothetical protein
MRTSPAFVLGDQRLLAVLDDEAHRLVVQQHIDAFGAEARGDQLGDLRVFADHQARQHFDLRYLGAEAGEGLRQLAADRPAAEYHQAFGQFAQVPDVVGGQVADLLDAGNRRHEGPRAGGDDDAARAEPFPWRRRGA